MAELSRYELGGRQRIMRHYYGDGRWGEKRSGTHRFGDTTFTKYRPRKTRWAKGDGSHGSKPKKVHAIKYRVRDDLTGIWLTAWMCGLSTFASLVDVKEPVEVCAGCHRALTKQPTTVRLQ